MSYGIQVPAHDSGKATVARDEFRAEADKVVDSYAAYAGQPLEPRVRAHMTEAVRAAGAMLSDATVIQGERFVVTISGHCGNGAPGDPDWTQVGIAAK